MTNKQYGIWLACMWAAMPGIVGLCGIAAGIMQSRVGPVVLGIIFLAIAYGVYILIYKIAKKWEGKE